MRSQKNCYYLIDAEVISFVVASKDKKSKKLTKIVTIEEVKIHIFRKTWWMSMKFSGKNVTYDDIKSDEKQSFNHWNIFFRLRRGFSLNETSILLFCQISNISFYLNKNDIRKNCQENHLVKVVKGIAPDVCFLVFAHVRYLRQNFGTCTWWRTTILW